MKCKPVAISNEGIIVTAPNDIVLKKLESNYDNVKIIINNILDKTLKIVLLSNDKWQDIRPKYVKKVKNKELTYLEETNIILKIKEINNKKTINIFDDIIEIE